MKKEGLLTLLVILFIIQAAFSQNVKKELKNANTLFEKEYYKEALQAYLEVIKLEPSNAEANYKAGKLYLKTIHHIKSLPYLKTAHSVNPSIAPDIKYLLASSYHYNHQFSEALEMYKAYRPLIDPNDPIKIKLVNRKIHECENGIEYLKHPVKAVINNMGPGINTKYKDFAPVISADESVLVFSSRREGSTGGALDEQNEYFEDVYISYQKNNKWTTPVNIGSPINTDGHDASIAMSPDGHQIFIYKDNNDLGSIYSSEFLEGKWSKPKDLGKHVNTKYMEMSVSMTADGKTIYFSSGRPGGKGDLDIYMSKKDKKGNWGEAINLGATINTEYKDDAPFIHPDGRTLYFSSEGHAGMGKYDIFKTTILADGTWSQPENLGYPINTADDDIYFVLSADNKHGYYASEREGGFGETDLYMISMPAPEELVVVETKVNLVQTKDNTKRKLVPIAKVESFNPITILKGTVKDAVTKQPLESDLVIVDNEKNEIVSEARSNSETGAFLVILPSGKNYGLSINKKEYLFHSENFDIPASTNYQEVNKDVELKRVAVGTHIVLRNIFFDFDKATLRPESTSELDRLYKLLVEVPNLKIEISGHTDNKGTAEYNKGLSESRAKSVVDFLIKKGIAAERLKFAGYGFDKPIAGNDTEAGRQLNRRTEFEIISN